MIAINKKVSPKRFYCHFVSIAALIDWVLL